MQPAEFIERLHRHYSKRHQSETDQAAWIKEMISVVDGTDHRVLDKAYELIRDEHEERAFPLPAVLKRFVARAGEIVYPESAAVRGSGASFVPKTAVQRYIDPRDVYETRVAREWQKRIIKEYGSWAVYYRSTRKAIIAQHARKPRWTLPPVLALGKLRRIYRHRSPIDRVAMAVLQRTSPNRHLHVDHAAMAKRITGERDD